MLLLGKPCAEKIAQEFGSVGNIKLCTVGFDNSEWQQYTRSLARSCAKYGFSFDNIVVENCTPEQFFDVVQNLSDNKDISGLIVQQPLPKEYRNAVEAISPEKDIDCLSPLSVAKLYQGNQKLAPATPTAVINLLDFYGMDLCGKNVVIVGRGNAVGKPLALLCLQRNATVTVCHTKTQNLADICKKADILISACGKADLITKDFVTEKSVVIDVGLSFVDGKTCGDVSKEVYDICRAVSPVPGGIGPITCVTLLQNLKIAYNNQ